MSTRGKLRVAAMLTFMLLFFGLVLYQKSRISRVMVIHSYNTDYDWVVGINEGLERAFEDSRQVLYRYHYMDLKNHTDPVFQRTATRLAHRVIDEWKPDVILLFDDVAQRLVGQEYHLGQDPENPDVKLVYGGVNGVPSDYYGVSDRVVGILERKPLLALKETMLAILAATRSDQAGAQPPRVMFIGDMSDSITAEIPYYASIDWAPLEFLAPVQVETFDQWKAAVARAGQEADIILLTNYQQIREAEGGAFIRPAARVMQWTEESATIPVLGMGPTNSRDGAMLSVSVSPFEQGEVAARMALEILGGASVAQMDDAVSNQFLVQVCAPSLAHRGLDLPALYEAFARATDNYFEEGC
jgi:hypothetical protein